MISIKVIDNNLTFLKNRGKKGKNKDWFSTNKHLPFIVTEKDMELMNIHFTYKNT